MVLLCAITLLASACGIDTDHSTISTTTIVSTTEAPSNTVGATVATVPKPTQSEVAEFLAGGGYGLDLHECLGTTAAGNTDLEMFVAFVQCDIDAIRIQVGDTFTSTDTAVLELYGLTSDEAAAYYQCGGDNALRFSADRYLTLATRASDLAEFGELLATLAYASCDRLLRRHSTLDDAPLTEAAVRTITGDSGEWSVSYGDAGDMPPGLSPVIVDNNTVLVILTVIDEVGRVPRIVLLFDAGVSIDESLVQTLDDAAGLFDIELDPEASELLRTTDMEIEFRDVMICSDAGSSSLAAITILPASAGCDE